MIDYLKLDNLSLICDWVELNIILNNKSMSKNDISSIIFQIDDNFNENKINSIFNFLKSRIEIYELTSPLEINDEVISLRENNLENYVEYLFYLILCVVDYEDIKSINLNPEKIFENITCQILKQYINTNSGIVIGHPNGNLKEGLDKFIKESNRRKLSDNYYLKNKNDAGVDSLIWKNIDSRGNQIIIFNQSTISKNYQNKQDISLEMWQHYFDFSLKEVIISISHPKFIDKLIELNEKSKRYGLIFDRGKLLKFKVKDEFLIREIKSFSNSIIENFIIL